MHPRTAADSPGVPLTTRPGGEYHAAPELTRILTRLFAMPPSALLSELNSPQREAVRTLSGPMLVLAGAGTGKTRVVTYRIAHLIANRTAPDRILGVTFTNKAAGEMQERIRGLLKRTKTRPEISTFHAYCVRLLRRQIHHLGYPDRFSIYATGQQESVIAKAIKDLAGRGLDVKPADVLYRISRWKSASVTPEAALEGATNELDDLSARVYRTYQKRMRALAAVDFDDLLLLADEVLTSKPAVRREESARFDHILVDEYQDTNQCQYRIVKRLAAGHRNLCVVGDDDQSIYAWRGAEVQHILGFQKDWPEAKVVRLEDNYRSAGSIIEVANRLIKCNRVRHPKTLKPSRGLGPKPRVLRCPDEFEEAKTVVSDISQRLKQKQGEPADFAILFRTNEQPKNVEAELRRQRIPYVLLGSMSFFDRREIRDVLAFISLLDHPQDDASLQRVLNVPARGVGDRSATAISEAAAHARKSVWDTLTCEANLTSLPAGARRGIETFGRLIETHRELLKSHRPDVVVRHLLEEIKYETELQRRYPEGEDAHNRWSAVCDVISDLGRIKSGKHALRNYLNDLMLKLRDPADDKESKLAQNAVLLLTMHAAKGLEFPHVYLIGMEMGLLPHRRSLQDGGAAIDEERRLCYVGVTRAEEDLTLSFAEHRSKWGRKQKSFPSRFLYELYGQPQKAEAVHQAYLADEAKRKARRFRHAAGGSKPKGRKPTKKRTGRR
ncbi:MAG: UvrD-helicase domain-containing protein [Planctomycetota bacterium]